MPDKTSFWRENGWKIAYFGGGVLFIGLSRFILPFWPRFVILVAWAIGLAFLFARIMSRKD
ncbi:MAG: hypothetical protein KKE73_06095 [Proteobacteria bacterium]|nr:hypothetical protein [Pseudomonadota bacterium]